MAHVAVMCSRCGGMVGAFDAAAVPSPLRPLINGATVKMYAAQYGILCKQCTMKKPQTEK